MADTNYVFVLGYFLKYFVLFVYVPVPINLHVYVSTLFRISRLSLYTCHYADMHAYTLVCSDLCVRNASNIQDLIDQDGYALKLRRPQDYNPRTAQQQLAVEMQLKGGISSLRGAANLSATSHEAPSSLMSMSAMPSAPGIVSTSVEDGPNKVFIGGLPHQMSETEVKALLTSFGGLKAFHLVKDRETDMSKGFAFCEWRDTHLTDIACAQLNGMKLADRFLNVRRAIGHQQHKIGAGLPALVSGSMPALTAFSDPQTLAITYDNAAAQVAAAAAAPVKPVPLLDLVPLCQYSQSERQ